MGSVDQRIYQYMMDLACSDGHHGWSPLDINWPMTKALKWANRRFHDQGKRVWTGIAEILDQATSEELQASSFSFIKDWKNIKHLP